MLRRVRWLPRLIGPIILGYFLLRTDLRQVASSLGHLRWGPFVLSLALFPLVVSLKTWRWHFLIRKLHAAAPPFSQAMVVYTIGVFLGTATPGQSGDFIKAWYLRKEGIPLSTGLFSVVLDRLFDLLAMTLLSLVGLLTFIRTLPLHVAHGVEASVVAFGVAIALTLPALMYRRSRDRLLAGALRVALRVAPRRLAPALERWPRQFARLDLQPGLMASLTVATVCSTAAVMGRLWLLFRALDIAIPLVLLVSSMALISLIQTLPITVAGVGVRDAVLITTLASYGHRASEALALSALFLALNLEHAIIGFLISLAHPLGRGRAQPSPTAGRAAGEIAGKGC